MLLGERDYFVAGFAPVEDDPEPEAPPDEDDPLGVDDEDDPLGDDVLEEDDPLGDEEDAPDEDDPLGDAAGLDDEPLALAWTPSFDAVWLSTRPVAFRPSFCW